MCKKIFFAGSENVRILRVFHCIKEVVDLLGFDSFQIVAYADVKLEAVHASQREFLCDHLAQKPRLDILFHGLRHIKLRGPLAVIALIVRLDARFIHTGG